MRFLILSMFLLLSGCYYGSSRDLHRGAEAFDPIQFYEGKDYAFKSADGEYLFLAHTSGLVKITRTKLTAGLSPQSAQTSLITRLPGLPADSYIFVEPNSGYRYYPFYYGRTQIEWLVPSSAKTFTDKSQMVRAINANWKSRKSYRKLSLSESAAARREMDRLVAEKKKNASNKKSTSQTAQVKPAKPKPAPTYKAPAKKRPTQPAKSIHRLDVGDGVYAGGLFSDELVTVARIDYNSGRVKVRRRTDQTTYWVHHSTLISREEAAGRNIGRAVGTGVLIVCLFSPETCKK